MPTFITDVPPYTGTHYPIECAIRANWEKFILGVSYDSGTTDFVPPETGLYQGEAVEIWTQDLVADNAETEDVGFDHLRHLVPVEISYIAYDVSDMSVLGSDSQNLVSASPVTFSLVPTAAGTTTRYVFSILLPLV